jgi:hypothetical protein
LKVAATAEQTWIGEVELTPQLVQAVFHRRTGQRETEASWQLEGGARDLRIRVLDVLRFVQNDRVPLARGERVVIQAQERVGRERDVSRLAQ